MLAHAKRMGIDRVMSALGRETWNSDRDQKRLVPDARVVFDVGAHVGDTVERYLHLYPNATIWAFEPAPNTCDQLQRRFKRVSRVRPVCLGLSDERGEHEFFLARGSQVNSMLPSNREIRQTIKIRTDTIDLFCESNSISCIDILKIDVEGMEGRLLQGASEMFLRKAIRVVLTEIYFQPIYRGMSLFSQLHAQFEEFGLQLFGLYSLARSARGDLEFGNALYWLPS